MAGRRLGRGVKSDLSYRPLLALLAAGVAVRLVAMATYFPAWMQSLDESRFARITPPGLFDDYWSPAGYAAIVRSVRELFPQLWVTIALQHIVGLGIGLLLFLALKRLGVKPWLACVPAAIALLSGDQIWIEHQVVAETSMTVLIAAGLACAVRGLVPAESVGWLAAGGALLAYGGLSRNVGFVAVPVLVFCSAAAVKGGPKVRLRAAAVPAVSAGLVVGAYIAVVGLSGGKYLGISDMSGWNLYSRVAPFADCRQFTPPEGTRRLCEDTDESERFGSIAYSWDAGTRGRMMYPIDPSSDEIVGKFARAAILNQPLDYLRTVAVDAARYIDPMAGPNRPGSGLTSKEQSFENMNSETRGVVEGLMSPGYDGARVEAVAPGVMSSYQRVVRPTGVWVLLMVVLTAAGMFVARDALRLGVFLFGLTAALLYLVAVATFSYEVRYGLPPVYFISASGVLGLAALIERRSSGAVVLGGSRDRRHRSEGRPSLAVPGRMRR